MIRKSPTILKSDGTLDGRLTHQSIQQLYDHIRKLESKLEAGVPGKGTSPALTGSGPVRTVAELNELQKAGGEHAQTIQSLLGRAAQPQIPYAPVVTSLPSIHDPQAQDGSLVIFSGAMYQFNGLPSPGAWALVPIIPAEFGVEAANLVLAGPATGAAALPTFRALVAADVPTSALLLDVDVTPVSVNASTTADQTLMTFVLPAGKLNTLLKTLRVTCWGNLDELSGPNITFKLAMTNGATTTVLMAWVPNTPSGTKTNLSWRMNCELVTAAIGASGLLEAHGEVAVNADVTNGTVDNPQLDFTTTSGLIDLTLAQTLKIQIAFSSASASNVGRQRMMLLELLN